MRWRRIAAPVLSGGGKSALICLSGKIASSCHLVWACDALFYSPLELIDKSAIDGPGVTHIV